MNSLRRAQMTESKIRRILEFLGICKSEEQIIDEWEITDQFLGLDAEHYGLPQWGDD